MVTQAAHPYVVASPNLPGSEPVIRGTRTPVRAIVELWRQGIPPEEMPAHLPHLSLAQVFGALSYYADNQYEVNSFIESNRVPAHLIHPVLQ